LNIRKLDESDAADYHELRLRGLREHPEAFTSSFEEEHAKGPALARTRLASPHDVVLGAFVDGRLAGVVGLSLDRRAKVRHKGHVFGMYVAPEHARGGVGRALLSACIARAREVPGLEQLELTVTDGNARPKAFYEKAGFRAFGVERNAIKLDTRYFDKCHMVLQL
jgi:RimJ/RimL family protein N-acetyltransferase